MHLTAAAGALDRDRLDRTSHHEGGTDGVRWYPTDVER